MTTLNEHQYRAAARGALAVLEVTPTIETSAYTSGDLVAPLITFSDPFGNDSSSLRNDMRIVGVELTDLGKQSTTTDVVFFDTNPSNTTFTVNSALDIHDTDLLNVVGVATVSDWKAFNDNSAGQATDLGFHARLANGAALYAALVARGAPTYASTADLTLRVTVMQW